MKRLVLILLFASALLHAQISSFPYKENFDSVPVPTLPSGWTTSKKKSPAGDFTTDSSTSFSNHSKPKFVISTDAMKEQFLVSPQFDFTGMQVDSIIFVERRSSSSYNSAVLIEASINNDTTFSLLIGDTLKYPNTTSFFRRSFGLPSSLNNIANVKFRWRVLGNGTTGATSTIRFDDIAITVKKEVDLSLSSFSISPSNPKKGDLVTITTEISNMAFGGNFSGAVQLFDSLTFIASQNFSHTFAANESLTVALNYPNINAGRHPFTAKLEVSGDEDTTNNSISAVVNAGYQSRTILINEFKHTGSPEWIEFVNNSSDTINIAQWKIGDNTSTLKTITTNPIHIPPHSFFITTAESLSEIYPFISSPVIIVPSFPTFNDGGDAIRIIDPTGFMIDSLSYTSSWSSVSGKSLERIDAAVASTLQSNWTISKHPLGATPGAINSVTQKMFDAAVLKIGASPQFPVAGDNVTVSTTVKNIGKQNALSIAFRLYLDTNNDSIPAFNEIQQEQNIAQLNSNDSIIIPANISSLPQGTHRVFASVSFASDDDTTNNLLSFSFSVGIPPQSVVITEIMYAPNGDEPEWIECYNRSGNSISLSGWKISDAGTTRSALTNTTSMIPAQSYFVVARDSTFTSYYSITVPLFFAAFSSLNNSTPDAVVLFDERGGKIDSVYYKPSWGGSNGNSLQRFDMFGSSPDSANWRSAAASAGLENLIARKDFDVEVRSIQTGMIANGTRIVATIANTGRQSAQSLSVKFCHDTNGDSIGQQNELLNSASISAIAPTDSASVQFDWIHSLQGKQSVIVSIEFSQDERLSNNTGFITTTNSFTPQLLVINEIMYEPLPGKAEFVELFNRSSDSIDVADWKLMDQPGSTGSRSVIQLSQQQRIVPPNGYVVIASDSSIFAQFPSLAGKFVILNSSLSLGNNGEDIVLVDLTNSKIDSVRYSPSWHLKDVTTSGRSLERINPNTNSNDARNWSSSVAKSGASPAQSNSIYIASASSNSGLTLTPNPFSPDNDGHEDFLSINYNLPTNSATIRVRIYDVTGRLIRRLAQSEPSPSSGSIIWNGLDDDGHRVRIGMYIILFEAFDNFGGTVKTMKDVAVVARKL